MGQVINPDSAGKERPRLTKSIVLALRELMRQNQPDDHSRDLAAYMAIALQKVYDGVESSVEAWEKKGYWVKADRFRMEWQWAERTASQLRQAVLSEDWGSVAMVSAQVAQKLMKVDVPLHNRIGEPWIGAYKILKDGK